MMNMIVYKEPDAIIKTPLYDEYQTLCEEYYNEKCEKYNAEVFTKTNKMIERCHAAKAVILNEVEYLKSRGELLPEKRIALDREKKIYDMEIIKLRRTNSRDVCYKDAGLYAAMQLGPTKFAQLRENCDFAINYYGIEGQRNDDITNSIENVSRIINRELSMHISKENPEYIAEPLWNEMCLRSAEFKNLLEKGTIRSVSEMMENLQEQNKAYRENDDYER